MEILAYGEDSLTLWALSKEDRLASILKALDDDTPAEECLVIYRPSFGRKGGLSSPQFGELDAIIASKRCVYLIESKWDRAGRSESKVVPLAAVQIARHAIFGWLRERWSERYSRSWDAFVRDHQADFSASFPVRQLPNANTLLACNLDYLLTILLPYPETTQNVVLYFHAVGRNPPRAVTDKAGNGPSTPFRLVALPYFPSGSSQFIQLS